MKENEMMKKKRKKLVFRNIWYLIYWLENTAGNLEFGGINETDISTA